MKKYLINYLLVVEAVHGVSIKPIAFLIIDNESNVKIVNLDNETIGDKLVNYIPDAIDKITEIINKSIDSDKKGCHCVEV